MNPRKAFAEKLVTVWPIEDVLAPDGTHEADQPWEVSPKQAERLVSRGQVSMTPPKGNRKAAEAQAVPPAPPSEERQGEAADESAKDDAPKETSTTSTSTPPSQTGRQGRNN